jgi:GNAT superfamily N-acetyltransferase
MINSQQFNPHSVDYRFTEGERFVNHHKITAHIGDKQVGSLEWHPKTGRVMGVEVDSEHRRKGIGTQMWFQAIQAASNSRRIKKPIHSAERTDAGDKWAKTVGGTVPRRTHVDGRPI